MFAHIRRFAIALLLWLTATPLHAQAPSDQGSQPTAAPDTRTQYGPLLTNSFVGVTVGAIDYAFTGVQLQPGFQAASVEIPRATVRVTLFGHQFNKYLSAQATYMRPVQYVSYFGVNGEEGGHHVWMHYGGISLMPTLPVSRRVSLFGEAGIGFTARNGFERGPVTVVRDAEYSSVLLGAGASYHLSETTALTGGVTYLRGSEKDNQPRTLLTSAGIRYTMRKLPDDRVAAALEGNYFFPRQLLQVEYTTGVGFNVNTFLSDQVPVFWGGNARVARGVGVHYNRNVFHTRKVFSFDIGASASGFSSLNQRERVFALSLYPLLRLTMVRTAPADVYFQYSLAGPTYISKLSLDTYLLGRHFTFQDFMGVGAFLGRDRKFTAGVKINHYSNGNLFTENAGVKVPLTVTLGYLF